jgi:hypothetical protein
MFTPTQDRPSSRHCDDPDCRLRTLGGGPAEASVGFVKVLASVHQEQKQSRSPRLTGRVLPELAELGFLRLQLPQRLDAFGDGL